MLTYDELVKDLDACIKGAEYGPYEWGFIALRAIAELHKPTADGLGCSYEFIECHDETGLGCDIPRTCNQYKPYPCATIQAIEKELE